MKRHPAFYSLLAVPGRWFKHYVTRFLHGASCDGSSFDLIVYDFDGVMTDNRVFVSETGIESVVANRGDGLGINMLKASGISQIILSTERNPVVKARADKIGLDVIQDCSNKASALSALATERDIELDRVLYVGNDLNDLAAMGMVGFPVAPFDAAEPVIRVAKFVTRASGGHGVIREMALTLFLPD